MSITEKLANLAWWQVLIIVAVLLVLRYVLLKTKSPQAKSAAEIAESLAVAMALVFFLIKPFLVQAFFIPSESMHPTLLEHDHILVNKFVYRFVHEPRVGEVVVFKSPPEAGKNEVEFIKRVIAVPGDTIRMTGGYVRVGDVDYHHDSLRENLERLSKVEIKDNKLYEDGKVITAKDLGYLIREPGAEISFNDGMVQIGMRELDIYEVSEFLARGHSVKLLKSGIYRDGKKVYPKKLAELVGNPKGKVTVFPGLVYRNGKVINEPYIAEDSDGPYPDMNNEWTALHGNSVFVNEKWIVVDKHGNQMVKIPKGKLLVMGDNRNNSHDARFWGLLDRKRVMGKAMFIFWPLTRIRWIH